MSHNMKIHYYSIEQRGEAQPIARGPKNEPKLDQNISGFDMKGQTLKIRGYRVWNPETDEVIESKHVSIKENKSWTQIKLKEGNESGSTTGNIMYDDDGSSSEEDSLDHKEIPSQPTNGLPEPKETHFGSTSSSGGARRISHAMPFVPEPRRQEIKTRRVVREPVHTKRGITDMYKGWEREEVERQGGASAGYSDVYYYAPDGTKMRNGPEVQTYCQLQKPPIL
uniref:MBD domain-containing protein n=1 Tax=Strigamia maritima TaxID=126957 RepID=T1IQ97_STRMM